MARNENRVVGIGSPQSRALTSAVSSSPLARAHAAQGSGEMQGLLDGLTQFRQGYGQWSVVKDAQDRVKGQRSALAGDGSPDSETKSKSFIDGYLESTGASSAIDDQNELLQKYDTEFDKPAGDFDQFVNEFFKEKTKGSRSDQFLTGYQGVMQPAILKLKQRHGETQAAMVMETNRANFSKRATFALSALQEAGLPVDENFVTNFSTMADEARIPGPDRNAILFEVIDSAGATNPDLYEVLKKNRGDTPAMYNIPGWRAKIDAAQNQAAERVYRENDRRERKIEKDRKEAQDMVAAGVVPFLLDGDKEGAEEYVRKMASDPFMASRASELATSLNTIGSLEKSLLGDEEAEVETEFIGKITSGEMTQWQVFKEGSEAGLGPEALRRLIGYQRQLDGDERRDAMDARREAREIAAEARRRAADAGAARNEAARAERERLNDPLYTQQKKRIEDAISVKPSQFDLFGQGGPDLKRLRAEAVNDFTYWWVRNKEASSEDIARAANRIIEGSTKQRDLINEGTDGNQLYPWLRYRTIADLRRATTSGVLEPELYEQYVPYVEEIESQQTTPPL